MSSLLGETVAQLYTEMKIETQIDFLSGVLDSLSNEHLNLLKEKYVQEYFRSLGMPTDFTLTELRHKKRSEVEFDESEQIIRLELKTSHALYPNQEQSYTLRIVLDKHDNVKFCRFTIPRELSSFVETLVSNIKRNRQDFMEKLPKMQMFLPSRSPDYYYDI
jgi:hypothetical protein